MREVGTHHACPWRTNRSGAFHE